LEGLPTGVVKDRGQLAVDLGPACRWHGRLGGDAAALEPVEAGDLKARCLAIDALVTPHLRLVGAPLGRPPDITGRRQPDDQHAGAGSVMVQAEHRAPSLTVTLPTIQPTGRERRQGTRDAEGTDWASSHCGSRSLQARLPTVVGVSTASCARTT
jgi:hypothetical protein